MLEVGNGGMTTHEYQAHFALWALLKAPLLIGCDITNMSEDTKNILMNKEIIAVNQDSLGKQGRRVHKVLTSEVWAVEVRDNGAGVVVVFFNQALVKENISVNFIDIGLGQNVSARDLVNKVDLGNFQTSFTA